MVSICMEENRVALHILRFVYDVIFCWNQTQEILKCLVVSF